MKYSSRLKRLGQIAGPASCPACRLWRTSLWPNLARPRPEPTIIVVCEMCDARTEVSTGSCDEGEVTIMRLAHGPLENSFTDPRAWAARRWQDANGEAEAHSQKAERDARRASPSPMNRSRKQGPGDRLRQMLFYKAATARIANYARLHARYGADPFPEIRARLEAAEGPDFEGAYRFEPFEWAIDFMRLRELKAEADAWARCAAAERIILGQVRTQTEEALASCERRASELADEARRKHEERQAEWERQYGENARALKRLSEQEPKTPAATQPAPPLPKADGPCKDIVPPAGENSIGSLRSHCDPPAPPALAARVFDDSPPDRGYFPGPIRRPPRR